MENFNDYLNERVDVSICDMVMEADKKKGGFDYLVSSFDELVKLPQFQYMKDIPDFEDLVYDITHTANIRQGDDNKIFRYSEKYDYFTMSKTDFGNAILAQKEKYQGVFDIVDDGAHIEVKLHNKFGKKRAGARLIRTTEKKGSVVSTAAQENSTCAIFNAFMSDRDKEIDFEAYGMFEEISKQYSTYFNKSWYRSFGHQMNAIINFLNQIGVDPYEYRAVRYGETYSGEEAAVEKAVVTAHKSFVTAWSTKLGLSKDACDPTDIFLFKYSDGMAIASELNELTSLINSIESHDPYGEMKEKVRKPYLENLIINTKGGLSHRLIPISLKKIDSENGSFEIMNVKENMRICKIDNAILEFTDRNVTINCEGKFDLRGFTDEDGNKQGEVGKLKLVMRTFGGNKTPYIDCSVVIGKKTCPTLGKVPVDMWRPTLGCTAKDRIDVCTKKFREALGVTEELGQQKKVEGIKLDLNTLVAVGKTNTTVGDVLNGLVRDAAKAGPNCLPFVIIH